MGGRDHVLEALGLLLIVLLVTGTALWPLIARYTVPVSWHRHPERAVLRSEGHLWLNMPDAEGGPQTGYLPPEAMQTVMQRAVRLAVYGGARGYAQRLRDLEQEIRTVAINVKPSVTDQFWVQALPLDAGSGGPCAGRIETWPADLPPLAEMLRQREISGPEGTRTGSSTGSPPARSSRR